MHRVPRPGLTTLAVAGRGLNEGLGITVEIGRLRALPVLLRQSDAN
jgi:hypothetical protein